MKAIEHTATQFLKFVAYKSEYMAYKASHQAAVVCILTLKLFCCPAALDLGLARTQQQIVELQKQLKTTPEWDHKCPLAIWTPEIEKLTLIPRDELYEPYLNLVSHLDVKQFKNKLAPYKELWPATGPAR